MKYLKTLLWVLILTLAVDSFSQTTEKDELVKSLIKLTPEQMQEQNSMFDPSIPCFDLEGRKVPIDSLMPLFSSGKYSADL
jgi:hypothetical protein